MMEFFSNVFEKVLNLFAIILLIAGAIVGGVIANSFRASSFLGVLIGIAATFVFEIIFFGVIAQIITIKNLLEKQSGSADDDQRNYAVKELLEKQNNILLDIKNKE